MAGVSAKGAYKIPPSLEHLHRRAQSIRYLIIRIWSVKQSLEAMFIAETEFRICVVFMFWGLQRGQIFSFDYDGSTVSNFQTITSQLFPTSVGGFYAQKPLLVRRGCEWRALYYRHRQRQRFQNRVFSRLERVGVVDFNRDGHPDYLLYNGRTRQTAIWYLSNNVLSSGLYGPTLPAGWSVVGVADFNGDGHPDYLLFSSSTRQTAIWYLNNNVFSSGLYGPTLPANWSVVGVADFNGDGHPRLPPV